MISKKLHSEIEAAGFRMKTFKVEHLEEISPGFISFVEQGLLDEDFYKSDLTHFNYDYKSALNDARSVIIIASPQCKSLIEFNYQGKLFTAVIPPTYIYPRINSHITNILNNVILEGGYHFSRLVLPLKLLAVRSGLAQYGRNNIAYVSGMGSFVRLSAFITDYAFEEDNWGEIKALDSCKTCTACVDKCPTGAIDSERFLIHAQNCITNFNEREAPMPEWVNPGWHDSIVGCMKCQTVCPHNIKLIHSVDERISFNQQETEMILDGSSFNSLPLETQNQISSIGLESYYPILPRNIRLIMDKEAAGGEKI